MSIQLCSLPNELLLHILSYITNIREKIRLASVCTRFYEVVIEACRVQSYKLVNFSDYMYESEYKRQSNNDRILNLHKLLRIAPRLTHLVDNVNHFDYENLDRHNKRPLPLNHTKYIYIDLCDPYLAAHFFGTGNTHRVNAINNISEITVLDIKTDAKLEIVFPLLSQLKVFKFDLDRPNPWYTSIFPCQLIDLLGQQAPNLEEIYFSTKKDYVHFDLTELMEKLAIKWPNLKAIKILYQLVKNRDITRAFKLIKGQHKFLKLEYLDFRGVPMPMEFWTILLPMTPNIKFLAFNPSTDQQILEVISLNCPNAKFNLERPFEIEEEFRLYNQRTYGFSADRYLYS